MKGLSKKLDIALRTGEVVMGSNSVIKRLLVDKAKLILVAQNCPEETKERIIYYSKLAKLPCKVVDNTCLELGGMSRRSHPVSALAIIHEGDSKILQLFNK